MPTSRLLIFINQRHSLQHMIRDINGVCYIDDCRAGLVKVRNSFDYVYFCGREIEAQVGWDRRFEVLVFEGHLSAG